MQVGRQEQQREVVVAALLFERWVSNSVYLGETKLQATSGARGVNGQRLAQCQSVDVMT